MDWRMGKASVVQPYNGVSSSHKKAPRKPLFQSYVLHSKKITSLFNTSLLWFSGVHSFIPSVLSGWLTLVPLRCCGTQLTKLSPLLTLTPPQLGKQLMPRGRRTRLWIHCHQAPPCLASPVSLVSSQPTELTTTLWKMLQRETTHVQQEV